jgi:hypothetical protein
MKKVVTSPGGTREISAQSIRSLRRGNSFSKSTGV